MLPQPGQILGAQIQSGGVGVDLTQARYCIFYSLSFSLGDFQQAIARIHRPGQKGTVFYFYLLASGTIDEQIMQLLERKEDIIQGILDALLGDQLRRFTPSGHTEGSLE
jgi:SNF2 family DNA or RNA helicase